ncbi:MAG: glycosyltransferase family 2 protein [Ilyomonas sp.]
MKISSREKNGLQFKEESSGDFFARGVYRIKDFPTPRISVITVCFNSEDTIRHTLQSVKNQTYSNIEHIIIDGASDDNTVQIAQSFPHVSKILSEKDKGIYDAMNKGLRYASGDIISILNSDDVYASNNVLNIVADLFEVTGTDTLYGDLQYVDARNINRILRNWRSGDFNTNKFKYGWMPPHPTFFVKREVYQKAGMFDTSLKTAADYEFMLRTLYKYKFSSFYVPEVLVKMAAGGASNVSFSGRLKANREDRKAWLINGLTPYFFTVYLKPARKIFQFINKEQLRRVLF